MLDTSPPLPSLARPIVPVNIHVSMRASIETARSSQSATRSCGFPQLKPNHPVAQDEYKHCLANRTVYVAGNSVARHWAFALEQLLQNNSAVFGGAKGPVREAQIARCGSGSFGRRDNPIACQMTAGHNTSIVFGWAQRVHTPSRQC